jgi:hypothetical protein
MMDTVYIYRAQLAVRPPTVNPNGVIADNPRYRDIGSYICYRLAAFMRYDMSMECHDSDVL